MTSPAPRYPAPLQFQLSHAGRFARALRVLHEEAPQEETAAFLWLEGRAEEVEVFTVDVLRAWSSGELGTAAAAQVIDDYLHELHASMEGWYGKWYAPSCCGPLARELTSGVRKRAAVVSGSMAPVHSRRADTLLDTVSDAPAADITARTDTVSVALASVHAMAPRPSRPSVARSARAG